MSEHDNLPKVDGQNEVVVETTTKTTKSETVEDITSSEADVVNIDEIPKTISSTKEEVEENVGKTKSQDEKHVDEIEASNAEDAEDETNVERHTLEDKDYHAMTMEQLVSELDGLLKRQKIQTISKQVNEIKSEFYSKYNALLEEKKDEFLNEGGNEIDFYYSNDTKKLFSSLYKDYKSKISAYYNEREQSLKENLKNRLDIIEEIKGLINIEENISTTYKYFKELQERWRNAGPIPRDKYNNAWNTYHHHVERFYDFLHLNRDLRDLDFKHNLEQKIKIIEQAEALAQDDNVNRSFRELQVLHKLWKEELGPVAKEHREEIWERFSEATKIIHDKRQAYYADLDKAYEKNLVKKEEIIQNIIRVTEESNGSHSSWQKKIKTIEALREEFFNAGKVPQKDNEATWTKFKEAVRSFNRKKNNFYKNLKKEQYLNLQKKTELIKIAEDNKDSEDFDTVTPLMKKIQSDWKKIGHVPRRDSDKIWKQFKAACNHYFDRLHAERKAENQELFDAFDKKQKLLEDIKNFETSKDKKADLKLLNTKIEEWRSIGNVPSNKRFIEGKFNKALDGAFNKLKIDKSKVEMIKFENKLENLSDKSDTRLLDNEQNFIRKKIGELKSEINQLENNLQFFSNIESDNPLVKDVHTNIDKHKSELEIWKKKLKKLKDIY
ncbi:MAG: DUF349 domain-containing protein [Winogradskyella sp.]|nr:DUF349 domain-containing protein [Winogradskyella sp.]